MNISEEIKKEFEQAKDNEIWAGANQTYRMILSGKAKIVLLGEDTEPKEIIMPLKNEAEFKKIPVFLTTKEEIGKLCKCPRPAAAGCLIHSQKKK